MYRTASKALVGLLLGVILAGCVSENPAEEPEAWAVTERDPWLGIPPADDFVVREASWQGEPVLIFTVHRAYLDGVENLRGPGASTPAVVHPDSGDHRIFGLSARSTHLGCTVGWLPDEGASRDIEDYNGDGVKDGRVIDKCHHSQWDAFARGKVLPGVPAQRDLAVLRLEIQDGVILANGFDGPIGPPNW